MLPILVIQNLCAQQYSMSLGVYSGINLPHTFDEGVNKDPRYKSKYELKFTPAGLTYGMDYEGFGFVITPGLYSLGQNLYVVNTSGGHVGLRKTDLQYLNVPVAFKFHIINLSFFRVSALASFSGAFLLDGKESISHADSKLTFPKEVYPVLPSEYEVEYDGVLVPDVENYTMLKKEDFISLQFFAAAGIRSDWDVSNHWRVSFDFRFNYGVLDPRSSAYLERMKKNETLYDIYGRRTDMFAQFSIGISRYIEFDKSDKERAKKLKGGSRKFTPKSSPKRKYSRPK